MLLVGPIAVRRTIVSQLPVQQPQQAIPMIGIIASSLYLVIGILVSSILLVGAYRGRYVHLQGQPIQQPDAISA